MSEAYAWFGAAYFFYDIWSMYKVYLCTAVNGAINGSASGEKQKSRLRKIADYLITQPLIILHHVFIGSFGFLLIVVSNPIPVVHTELLGLLYLVTQPLVCVFVDFSVSSRWSRGLCIWICLPHGAQYPICFNKGYSE